MKRLINPEAATTSIEYSEDPSEAKTTIDFMMGLGRCIRPSSLGNRSTEQVNNLFSHGALSSDTVTSTAEGNKHREMFRFSGSQMSMLRVGVSGPKSAEVFSLS